MSASKEFVEYIEDVLFPIPDVSAGRFFGGKGFKSGGKQFAMIMGNTLYFCVDDLTRGKYEQRGMEPFSYSTKKRRVLVRKYFAVPEELIDEQDELIEWANEAIETAHRAS